jgi:hypothetical protein
MRNSLLLLPILWLATGGLAWAQPAAGPAAYWTCDEVSGISVWDRAPGGNLGTLFNDVRHVKGRVGQALAFGPDGFMEVQSAPQLDLTKQWSIDFWLLLPENATRDGMVMGKGYFTDAWDMYVGHNGALNLRIGGGLASDHTSKPVATPGQWTHIVWTYDADQPKAGLKLYANGALAQTWDETAPVKLTDKPLRVQPPGTIDELKLYQRPLTAEEIAAEYQAPEKGFGKPVFISKCFPTKLLYRPGEAVELQAGVACVTPEPHQVSVKIYLISGLDNRFLVPGPDPSFQLGPREVHDITIKGLRPDARFGVDLVVELYEGNTLLDRKSDTFFISDNPYQVGQKGAACLHGWTDDTARQQREQAVRIRQYYLPIAELLGVGPDNFSKWVPDTDKWFAGQGSAAYRNSTEAVRALTSEAHKHGIFIVPYINSAVSGVYGTQFAADHPEWMLYDARGHVTGGVETRVLELEQQFYRQYPASVDDKGLMDAILKPDAGAGLQIAAVNLAKQEAVRFSVEQLLKGMKYFGFDGLRWDGHYQVAAPSDPAAIGVPQLFDLDGKPAAPDQASADRMSAANTRMCNEMIRKEIPWAVFGYNWGLPWKQWGSTRPQDYAECCRNGGMILWESVNHISDATSPWHRWKDVADAIADEADHPHVLGGFLNVGWFPWWEAKDVYGHHLLAMTFAARAHFDGAPGRNPVSWLRFAARYSEFLYDLKIDRAPELQKALSVGPGPVWWQKYVYLRETPQGKQVILHLINPPATETVEIASTQEPTEQKDLQVKFALPNGYTPKAPYLLSPDLPDFGGKVEYKVEGKAMIISVPSLKYWDMLVLQFG